MSAGLCMCPAIANGIFEAMHVARADHARPFSFFHHACVTARQVGKVGSKPETRPASAALALAQTAA